MSNQTLLLVDGENLVTRFEALCDSGKIPKNDVIHKKGTYVWHPAMTTLYYWEILRASFYTTFVGGDDDLIDIKNEISKITYEYQIINGGWGKGTLNPHIFKKSKRAVKTKSVDINIAIDSLRHAHNKDVYRIAIFSGDGDYIPLIQEIMHNGIVVQVSAFSSGCHPSLKHIPDDFTCLDNIFFEAEKD